MTRKMMILVDQTKCFGCGRCELACSFAKENKFNFAESRIHLVRLGDKVSSFPLVCQQCVTAACTFACPTGAITKDSLTGIVTIDPSVCVGCLMCFLACPLGGISVSPETMLPIKCDLCEGEPECVLACDYSALEYVEIDEANALRRVRRISKLSKALNLLTCTRLAI